MYKDNPTPGSREARVPGLPHAYALLSIASLGDSFASAR